MLKAFKESPVLYSAFSPAGTPMVVDLTGALGILSAKNWSATGEFVPVRQQPRCPEYPQDWQEHCYDCPVGCSQMKLAKTGPYAGILTGDLSLRLSIPSVLKQASQTLMQL